MINIQNIDDNECFKWCLVRYLNLADCKSARITQADKDLVKKLDFKDIKLPVKVSDIYKIEKKRNSISISVFSYEINKNVQFIYQTRNGKKYMLI